MGLLIRPDHYISTASLVQEKNVATDDHRCVELVQAMELPTGTARDDETSRPS